jgi:imidazoleglycerol-phosphate dehydratase/histidinol-phosphatase
MKKVLFIDRDGTIVKEPPIDFQLDSYEKLEFLYGAIRNLYKIQQELDYKFVMVTNQDGLGTDSFPANTFWPVHNKMLAILKSEGVHFEEILIDESLPEENSPNRKPGTGMLEHYIKGRYDLENSFVIGDRLTDVQLAHNLGSKSIYIADEKAEEATFTTNSWNEIYDYLTNLTRTTTVVSRKTKETDIHIEINLNGTGKGEISTGIRFFDHMLDQLAKHGGIDLICKVDGDLDIDEHHTIEDTAIALGEAFHKALGNKKGIMRYGFLLPMDECLAQVAIDFGGRNWIVWDCEFKREKVGEMPTEMFYHFFKSFSDSAKCNLNIKVEGDNEHHKIEAIFKAWAKAIKMAIAKTGDESIPSTKGMLE